MVDVEGGRLNRATGVNRRHAGQVGIFGVGGDDVARHHMADGVGCHAAALDGRLDGSGGQLCVGHVFERAAKGADGGAGGSDDEDIGAWRLLNEAPINLAQRQ